jgi:hypothetical protein
MMNFVKFCFSAALVMLDAPINPINVTKSIEGATILSQTNICEAQGTMKTLFDAGDYDPTSKFFAGDTAPLCSKSIQIRVDTDLHPLHGDGEILKDAYQFFQIAYNETGEWLNTYQADGITIGGIVECQNYVSLEAFAWEFLKFAVDQEVIQPCKDRLLNAWKETSEWFQWALDFLPSPSALWNHVQSTLQEVYQACASLGKDTISSEWLQWALDFIPSRINLWKFVPNGWSAIISGLSLLAFLIVHIEGRMSRRGLEKRRQQRQEQQQRKYEEDRQKFHQQQRQKERAKKRLNEVFDMLLTKQVNGVPLTDEQQAIVATEFNDLLSGKY